MGSWGSGPFDNDDAADWAWSLEDSADDAVLRAALRGGADTVKPDASTSQVAIAAVAVVAAARSGGADQLPEEVAAWLDAHRDLPWSDLAELARAALANVAKDSELLDLWAESDDAETWRADLEELRSRL
jgi:hypothetical protein